jgi:hypothetical protein
VADVDLPLGGTTRGGSEETVAAKVSELAQEIRFHVPLELTEYPAYDVAISQTETGEQVFQRHGLKPTDDALVFMVPAGRVPPGGYQITVHGIQDDGKTDPLPVLNGRDFEIQRK